MNENFIKYLNDLSYQDVKKIHNSFVRDYNPSAKAYWGRVLNAKKFGWNDATSQRFAQDLTALGQDRILSVIPDLDRKKITDKVSRNLNTPFKIEEKKPVSDGKYINQITPSSFSRTTGTVPSPEDLSLEPIISPSRAQSVANSGSGSSSKNNGSNPPKKEEKSKVIDRPSLDEAITAPERQDPANLFKKPLTKDRKMGDDTAFFEDPEISAALKKLRESSIAGIKDQFAKMELRKADEARAVDLARREKLNYFLQDAKDTIGPLMGVFDFIEQRRQEKQAGRVADRAMLNAPSAPTVRGENRILSNLINQSQVAYSNPAQMIQPYMDQVNLGYQQDINQAQELSGGQAGTAMGLGQAASIRRNQANLQTAPMLSEIYKQGLETTGALVGQQMQDDTWRDQQNIDLYKTANQNNQELQRVAGQGLAASRLRSIQARNNMLDQLLSSPVFDVNTYMNQNREELINPPKL